MQRKQIFLLAIFLLGVLLLGAAGATAAPQADEAITWWTVDGGGGRSQGGGFVLHGTVGQPDAASSCGGVFDLSSGFWPVDCQHRLYTPVVQR